MSWKLVEENGITFVDCPIKQGYTKEIIRGVACSIPPVGYIEDFRSNGELLYIGVEHKNRESDDFYWERSGYVDDYEKKRKIESRKQDKDPDYIDQELEEFREYCWLRRMGGCWFYNGKNGTPTYITGTHWLYLEWWYIGASHNSGYPDYRESDRKYFLFSEHCNNNPNCFGTLLLTKRRDGKTQKSTVFGFDRTSKLREAHFGIQSKNAESAEKEVFKDSFIRAFRKLPHFFKPKHDANRLANIKNSFRYLPAKEDKEALELGNYLNGWTEWRSSEERAFDGTKLYAYVGDEIFKTQNSIDIYARWDVVKFCLLDNNQIWGKANLTSTVEEIEGSIETFIQFYQDSDQSKLSEHTNRTKSGLFRFFLPADEARNRDKYGQCNKEKNEEQIRKERLDYEDDPKRLISLIRKEPLTEEEAFRSSINDGLFDSMRIANRIDEISWKQDLLVERGNFVWKDFLQSVQWVADKNGRWLISKNHDHPEESLTVVKEGFIDARKNKYNLLGKGLYCSGNDPFSHSKTESGKGSNGAFYIKSRYNPLDPERTGKFVVQYLYRHKDVDLYYDDVLRTVFHYGCDFLLENQKIGIVAYLEDLNCEQFMIKLEGNKNYGIAANKKTTLAFVNLIEQYITNDVHKVDFIQLLNDWMNARIDKTQDFDAFMASGYTLLADSKILIKKKNNHSIKLLDINDIF